ncbi:MAG: NAD-dependent succinate-semialdehyde dehydrogenase [Verrucomicrobia bacterium]|nr:NAD-dependent succinate-semialdehyde dehydrogenase [Verrucomicrobiota bacterium]
MIQSSLIPEFAGHVNGRWKESESGQTIRVVNPATGDLLAEIPDMDEMETKLAIESADRALAEEFSFKERQNWLLAITELLLEHREELARIITLEQGKPLKEATVEVEYAAEFFSFFAGQLGHISPRALPDKIRGCRWTVHYRPAGVAGLITPWNFPLGMMAKKVSAAIAAGCSVVFKPSELTPLSAIAFWSLAAQAGMPMSRMNLVLGRPGPIGKVLCIHPSVRVLSFTGSTATGKVLLQQTASYVKRVLLELGGNAPFIVFQDADVDLAVEALVANKFRCAGQTCVCANRVFLHLDLEEKFIEKLAERVAELRVGNGLHTETDIGPLINRAAFDKVARHVADALRNGAKRIVGHDPEPPSKNSGCYYPPTLLTGARQGMQIFKEETFGPVIAVAGFSAESDVIELANSTAHGLAAYVFTRDYHRAERCTRHLHFGHVAVNSGTGPTPEAPFGGMMQSGLGREGGVEGLVEFCEIQTTVIA